MVIKKCIADIDIHNTISTDVRLCSDVDIRNILFFGLFICNFLG